LKHKEIISFENFSKQKKDLKKSYFLGRVIGGKKYSFKLFEQERQSKTLKLLILYFYTMEMGFKENCY